MLIVVAIVAPGLVGSLAGPLLAAAAVSVAIAGWYTWRSREADLGSAAQHVATRNPLDLWFVSKFGLLLAVIIIISRAAKEVLGNRGLFAVAGISGLADVDAITLSTASMFSQGQIQPAAATTVILIPAAVNTLVKPAIMTVMAGVRASIRVWIPLLAALGAGGLVYWLEVR
jgi:uncharacterized membrane protein (DUF4010 family)